MTEEEEEEEEEEAGGGFCDGLDRNIQLRRGASPHPGQPSKPARDKISSSSSLLLPSQTAACHRLSPPVTLCLVIAIVALARLSRDTAQPPRVR
ncbi:hypothetical protein PABG_11375 [Paracoccidioides brasiliensis Pb03]|nr:hypothetical protein PABG_11375 [Paracoccidioides brasiliensis Pb03]